MSRLSVSALCAVLHASLPLGVCGLCAQPALGQMDSHPTSVTLIATLPERVSVTASSALYDGSNSLKQGMTSILIATSWVTNTQRDSISVYLDYQAPASLDASGEGSRTPASGIPSGKRNSLDQQVFSQHLSAKNRNASRVDTVDIPRSATSDSASADTQGSLKLRVQVL